MMSSTAVVGLLNIIAYSIGEHMFADICLLFILILLVSI